MLTCTILKRTVFEVGFQWSPIVMRELTVLPFPIPMIPAFPTRISSIWMRTICMDGQCLNLSPLIGFVFSSKMRLMCWSCKNYPMMLKMAIYSRWIFTVQLTYTIVTMTNRSPPSHYWSIVICTHPLSKRYFQNLQLKLLPICGIKSST